MTVLVVKEILNEIFSAIIYKTKHLDATKFSPM